MFDNLNGEPVTLDHIRKSLRNKAADCRRAAKSRQADADEHIAAAHAHNERAEYYEGMAERLSLKAK